MFWATRLGCRDPRAVDVGMCPLKCMRVLAVRSGDEGGVQGILASPFAVLKLRWLWTR